MIFDYGAARLLAITPGVSFRREAWVRLADEAFVTDLITQEDLGRTDEILLQRRKDPPHMLFGLAPGALPELRVEAPETAERGKVCKIGAELAADFPTDGWIVRFDVYGPDGQQFGHYRKFLKVHGGRCEYGFPVALSDPPGLYRVKAVDLYSGKSVFKQLEVR